MFWTNNKRYLILVHILIYLANTNLILDFEQVVKLRGAHLVNNRKNSNNVHETFAILENQGQSNEAYRRIDCDLLIKDMDICQNCQKLRNTLIKIQNRNLTGVSSIKVSHASQEVLIEKVQL
jgi:hypothetical protein